MVMKTKRLILRQWCEADFAPFARMNADPEVMRYFPSVLSDEESHALAQRGHDLIAQKGWGIWALEAQKDNRFLGFVGLHAQAADSGLPDAPFIEIGWRLCASSWGNGFATEAAHCALQFAFEQLDVSAVYALTALVNVPSQRVMQKLGMQNTGKDFDHPKLAKGHRLERHCLYRLEKAQWRHQLAPK